jgi:hypothetical protein
MKKIKKLKYLTKKLKQLFCVEFNSEPECALITTHLFLKSIKISEIKKPYFSAKSGRPIKMCLKLFFYFFLSTSLLRLKIGLRTKKISNWLTVVKCNVIT